MRYIETLAIAVGVAFYAGLLHHLGLSEVVRYVRIVGWGLGLTVALESISRIANTIGWRVTIAKYPSKLKFTELFVARIAGEAIDYTTPSAQLGGQFVMATMVRRHLPLAIGLATVIAAALAEAIGQIGFVCAALLGSIRLASAVRLLFWPVIGGLSIAVALVIAFAWVQLRRPFSHLWRAAVKLNLPRVNNPELSAAAGEADAALLEFYAAHRGRLLLATLCYLIAWSMGPVEIYILLRLLHQPVTIQVALLIEAAGLLIERATFFIPGKLVSQEGGKMAILTVLGYPAVIGFAVGLMRRIKELIWVMLGLVSLAIHRALVEQADTRGTRAKSIIGIPGAPGEQPL